MHSVKWMTASDLFTFVTVRALHTSLTDGLLIFSENLRDAEKMFLGATFMCAFLLLQMK